MLGTSVAAWPAHPKRPSEEFLRSHWIETGAGQPALSDRLVIQFGQGGLQPAESSRIATPRRKSSTALSVAVPSRDSDGAEFPPGCARQPAPDAHTLGRRLPGQTVGRRRGRARGASVDARASTMRHTYRCEQRVAADAIRATRERATTIDARAAVARGAAARRSDRSLRW